MRFFKKKKNIVIILIILIIIFAIYSFTKNGDGVEYLTESVVYGDVMVEVSETGMIKVSEKASLGFKNSGKISVIYVSVGDKVKAGQRLAKLNTSQLFIELSEAEAALDVANADYRRLLAGSSIEEIKITQTDVVNAEQDLANSETTLANIKRDADEDLNQAYTTAGNELNNAYLDVYNALIAVRSLEAKYFGGSSQNGIAIRNSIGILSNSEDIIELYINIVISQSEIANALSETKKALINSRLTLANVRSIIESSSFSVTATDKTIIDTQRTSVNTAHNEIVSAEQLISTTKITNSINISDGEADVASAKIASQKKKDELALKKAGPIKESVNFYLAKIKQASTKVSLLNNKISEATLRSPANGQVIAINKRRGETAQSSDSVIEFLSAGPFQVEVNIYEEDIVNVAVDNTVLIELPALPSDIFLGKVVSINPAEKLIDGIVYYEVNISIEVGEQNIKPGMTADVIIETAKKENVLIVPSGSIEGKRAKVYIDNKMEYWDIEIGLEGDDYTEIISGLSSGDTVIVGERQ